MHTVLRIRRPRSGTRSPTSSYARACRVGLAGQVPTVPVPSGQCIGGQLRAAERRETGATSPSAATLYGRRPFGCSWATLNMSTLLGLRPPNVPLRQLRRPSVLSCKQWLVCLPEMLYDSSRGGPNLFVAMLKKGDERLECRLAPLVCVSRSVLRSGKTYEPNTSVRNSE